MGWSREEQERAKKFMRRTRTEQWRAAREQWRAAREQKQCHVRASVADDQCEKVVGAAAVPGAGDEDGGADHPPVDTGQEEQHHGQAGREGRGLDGVLCL